MEVRKNVNGNRMVMEDLSVWSLFLYPMISQGMVTLISLSLERAN